MENQCCTQSNAPSDFLWSCHGVAAGQCSPLSTQIQKSSEDSKAESAFSLLPPGVTSVITSTRQHHPNGVTALCRNVFELLWVIHTSKISCSNSFSLTKLVSIHPCCQTIQCIYHPGFLPPHSGRAEFLRLCTWCQVGC